MPPVERIRTSLYEVVNQTDRLAGRIFDRVVVSLILLSILIVSLETLPNLPALWQLKFAYVETTLTVLFTLEYALRVFVAPKRTQYIFRFYGLVDLLAVVPFYFSAGVDLLALRAFRLLKLVRYTSAVVVFSKAMKFAKGQLLTFGFATLVVLFISSAVMYAFEHRAQPDQFRSLFDSMWWVIENLLRINMGYRDMQPATVGGNIFAHFMMLYGIVLVAVPAGIFASALSKVYRERERRE